MHLWDGPQRWWLACSFRGDSPVAAGVEVFQLRAARWQMALLQLLVTFCGLQLLEGFLLAVSARRDHVLLFCQGTC